MLQLSMSASCLMYCSWCGLQLWSTLLWYGLHVYSGLLLVDSPGLSYLFFWLDLIRVLDCLVTLCILSHNRIFFCINTKWLIVIYFIF
jgi:hypothetical protein